MMNRAITFCCGERFCVVPDKVNLLSSIDDVVLIQDTYNSLFVRISFHHCRKHTIVLYEDRGGLVHNGQLVEELLLLISTTEWYMFTAVNNAPALVLEYSINLW